RSHSPSILALHASAYQTALIGTGARSAGLSLHRCVPCVALPCSANWWSMPQVRDDTIIQHGCCRVAPHIFWSWRRGLNPQTYGLQDQFPLFMDVYSWTFTNVHNAA